MSKIDGFFKKLSNFQKKIENNATRSKYTFHQNDQNSDDLKKKFHYVWKNKFL